MVDWLPWSGEAFARAARERKPVLLSITAAWCHACHEMDRTTYADPEVALLVGDRFIAVRVDTDRRPDINERYNLGGWPTTAFLTADGAVITGGTFVPVDRMVGVLTRVASALQTSGGLSGPTGEARGLAEAGDAGGGGGERNVRGLGVDEVIESIFSAFGEEHGGGWGAPQIPPTAPPPPAP